MKGICCSCQSQAPVIKYRGHWITKGHSAFGAPCEGEGTEPQAILGEEDPFDDLLFLSVEKEMDNIAIERMCRE
jgi:hypothetical protein